MGSELQKEQLIEELAAIEHERWAHWQSYLHSKCERLPDGRLIIPADLAQRWQKQIETSYDQLSNEEKESDREQVERVVPVLLKYLCEE